MSERHRHAIPDTLDGVPAPTPTPADEIADVLGDLVSLLDDRLTPDPLIDYFAEIATIVLAVAAVAVAVFSWRTARRANSIVEEHREEDRTAKEARFRRGVAVDMRDWATQAVWRARFGVYFETKDDDGRDVWDRKHRIEARLEREGEENGLRLMNLMHRRIVERNFKVESMTTEERAMAMHPSRINEGQDELLPLVKAWSIQPSSIETELQAEETGEAVKNRARLEALRRTIDRLDAEADTKPNDNL